MIPYIAIPLLHLGPLTLSIFGVLVATGVLLGTRLSWRFGRARNVDRRRLERLTTWAVVAGLVVAHWVSVLGYFPERVAADPWLLLRFFDGISSVGGFLGGVLAFAWLTRNDADRWSVADALTYGLVAGFTVGRLGCALVHDHPGALVDPTHPLAVGPWPDGSIRLDLGLIEFVGMCGLSGLTYLSLWRRPGVLTLSVAGSYAVGRFGLDFLRADDLRHFGLTTAQWATLVLALGCVAGLVRLAGRGGVAGTVPAAAGVQEDVGVQRVSEESTTQ